MMIAAVDQNDVDVGVTQGTRCGDSGKAGADDDDALPLSAGSFDDGRRLVRLGLGQNWTHWFTSFVLFVIDDFRKPLSDAKHFNAQAIRFATPLRRT
jgi:hypothetical protein